MDIIFTNSLRRNGRNEIYFLPLDLSVRCVTTNLRGFFIMATNPIFPLYYNDIDRSTRDWTDEEFGCYMRLLMHQWDQGEIPKDEQRRSRIVTSLGKSWVTVGKKFVEKGEGLVNERLEEIRIERGLFIKKQQENGQKGGRKPKNNPNTNPNTNPKESLHIELEHDNEDVIEIESISDLSNFEKLKTIEYLKITCQRDLSENDVGKFWKAFLIHSEGEKHKNRTDQIQHFRNWLKKQPNGNSKDTKLGTSAARMEALKNW